MVRGARRRFFGGVKRVPLQPLRLANARRRQIHNGLGNGRTRGLLVLADGGRTPARVQLAPSVGKRTVEQFERLRRQALGGLEKRTHGLPPRWQAGAQRCLSATGAWYTRNEAMVSALCAQFLTCRGINDDEAVCPVSTAERAAKPNDTPHFARRSRDQFANPPGRRTPDAGRHRPVRPGKGMLLRR